MTIQIWYCPNCGILRVKDYERDIPYNENSFDTACPECKYSMMPLTREDVLEMS